MEGDEELGTTGLSLENGAKMPQSFGQEKKVLQLQDPLVFPFPLSSPWGERSIEAPCNQCHLHRQLNTSINESVHLTVNNKKCIYLKAQFTQITKNSIMTICGTFEKWPNITRTMHWCQFGIVYCHLYIRYICDKLYMLGRPLEFHLLTF